ncbi:solute carrier family 43 member 3 isoform X2 [Lingula anatina]|nr:solute carrier family 43 member 3 isoform X2 [Lingula anatina]XP_013406049.1 solute carrier family 43 member 3 isoform X2 [Lingula anatina]|eukprot:XP_013406048.1 solute carrier family 43 member 3 isoform X2 [Lingula anatina]
MPLGWDARASSPLPWKLLVLGLTLLEAGVYSFSLYAWPSLVYIFKHEHFFESACQAGHNGTEHHRVQFGVLDYDKNINSTSDDDCEEQDQKLNLVYSIAITLQVVLPVLGYLYDHCGMLFIRSLCIFFACGGCSLMAVASSGGLEWLLLPGATLQLLGGSMLSITGVQMTSLFPGKQSTLASLLSGACDMSMVSPLFIKLAYDAGFPFQQSMLVFAALTFCIATTVTLTLPHRRDKDGNIVHNNKCSHAMCGALRIDKEKKDRSPSHEMQKGTISLQFPVEPTETLPLSPNVVEGPGEGDTSQDRSNAKFRENGCQNGSVDQGQVLGKVSLTENETTDLSVQTAHIPVSQDNKFSKENESPVREKSGNMDADNVPNEHILTEKDTSVPPSQPLLAKDSQRDKSLLEEKAKSISSFNASVLTLTDPEDAKTFKAILRMPLFWVTQFWLVCATIITAVYFGIFNDLITYLAHEDHKTISQYTNVFGWLQLSGMPLSMLAGYLADRQHSGGAVEAELRTFILSFMVPFIAALLVSVSCAIPVLQVQYGAAALHCVLKSFTYGTHFAFVSFAFPSEHFGKAYSWQLSFSTLFLSLQYPLFYWYKAELKSEPLYLSLVLVAVSFGTLCLPGYLILKERQIQREKRVKNTATL